MQLLKRKMSILVVATLAIFGLAGCSGGAGVYVQSDDYGYYPYVDDYDYMGFDDGFYWYELRVRNPRPNFFVYYDGRRGFRDRVRLRNDRYRYRIAVPQRFHRNNMKFYIGDRNNHRIRDRDRGNRHKDKHRGKRGRGHHN